MTGEAAERINKRIRDAELRAQLAEERIARVQEVCDRAEAHIAEQYKIKQAGHINTLQIRCALRGEPDPWEMDILNEVMPMIDGLEKVVQDETLSAADFRVRVTALWNEYDKT